jgi:hypothetical protein
MRVLLTKQEDEVRKSRFSEEQIIGLLKEAEAGRKVADLAYVDVEGRHLSRSWGR